MTKMLLFLFPPWFPTFFWWHTYTSSVAYPLIPIGPIVYNLLPLETRRVEKKGSKKPCTHHKPHRYSDQDIGNSTSISMTKDLVHKKQDHELNSLDKVTTGVQSIIVSKLGMEHHKPSTCGPIFCTPMKQCPSIVVGLCPERECEKYRGQLQLHQYKFT